MSENENTEKTSKTKSRNVSENEDGSATPSRKSARVAAKSRSETSYYDKSEESPPGWRKRLRRTSSSSENQPPNSSTTPVKKSKEKSSSDELAFTLSPLKEELENELKEIEENTEKPSELFLDEEDISGDKMYGFQTPAKKNAMAEKALLSRTPVTKKKSTPIKNPYVLTERLDQIKTPKSSKKKLSDIEEKPKTLVRVTRRNPQVHFDSESDESVSEDSEYIPTDNEDDENDNDNASEEEKDYSNNESQSDENNSPKRGKQIKKLLVPITPCRRGRSKNKIVYQDYHMNTDDYFASQSEKTVTSNNTMNRLKNPRLNEEKLKELLSNENYIPKIHKEGICTLAENCRSQFEMWYHIMEEGYSLLLHGLGSKRNIIHNFHNEMINNHPTFIVNGFFPSLTIKEILDGIIIDLLGLDCPTNQNDCFNLIDEILRDNPDDRLYLLIHNIDGVMLRSSKSQDILSRLAAIPNIRLLASVDHINSPLLWDNVKRSRYNFYWCDATTLLPYEAETMYESSLLVQQSGALALSSLNNVFASLTKNAKAIYILLIKYQIENGKGNHYSGMPFKDLYRGARENFYVSSDGGLRAQLTEFIDHKLVKTKRNHDGAEHLIIPLNNSLLNKFLEDQET